MSRLPDALRLLAGDPLADRVVPPTGFTARLTLFAAGAMAFLAVFALALSLTAGRVADRWAQELAQSATLRVTGPADELTALTNAAMRVLETTPGVARARALSSEDQTALLEPWLGADLPLDELPIPQLIEITPSDEGIDSAGLRARLEAEVPGAIFDDHSQWRRPLVDAAARLRTLGAVAVLLIAGVMAAMVTLAAQAALSANAQVIRVLRLVGARDAYIARAFVRRFTLRALAGAAVGTALGMAAVALLPKSEVAGGFLTGVGFAGAGWLWPVIVPPFAAVAAFFATRRAALHRLKEIS